MIIEESITIPVAATEYLKTYLNKGYTLVDVSLYYNDVKLTTLYLTRNDDNVSIVFKDEELLELKSFEQKPITGWDANGSPIEE